MEAQHMAMTNPMNMSNANQVGMSSANQMIMSHANHMSSNNGPIVKKNLMLTAAAALLARWQASLPAGTLAALLAFTIPILRDCFGQPGPVSGWQRPPMRAMRGPCRSCVVRLAKTGHDCP